MYSRISLEGALSSFIADVGASRGGVVKLGGAAAPGVAAESQPAQREQLLADLELAGRGSRMIVWLWVALIGAIFALSAGFAVYHRDNIGFVAASLLGGSGIMAFLLAQVRSVHTKLVSTQLLLALLPNLPPAQWVKVAIVLMDEIVKAPPSSQVPA
jgi:hypothetical protein